MKKLIILLVGIFTISISSYAFTDEQHSGSGTLVKYYNSSAQTVYFRLGAIKYYWGNSKPVTSTLIVEPSNGPTLIYQAKTVLRNNKAVIVQDQVSSLAGWDTILLILNVPSQASGTAFSTIWW